jgi:hypothetical protein
MNIWIPKLSAHHRAPIMLVAAVALTASMGAVSAQERQPSRSNQHCDATVASTMAFDNVAAQVTSLTADLVAATEGYPNPGLAPGIRRASGGHGAGGCLHSIPPSAGGRSD